MQPDIIILDKPFRFRFRFGDGKARAAGQNMSQGHARFREKSTAVFVIRKNANVLPTRRHKTSHLHLQQSSAMLRYAVRSTKANNSTVSDMLTLCLKTATAHDIDAIKPSLDAWPAT